MFYPRLIFSSLLKSFHLITDAFTTMDFRNHNYLVCKQTVNKLTILDLEFTITMSLQFASTMFSQCSYNSLDFFERKGKVNQKKSKSQKKNRKQNTNQKQRSLSTKCPFKWLFKNNIPKFMKYSKNGIYYRKCFMRNFVRNL